MAPALNIEKSKEVLDLAAQIEAKEKVPLAPELACVALCLSLLTIFYGVVSRVWLWLWCWWMAGGGEGG